MKVKYSGDDLSSQVYAIIENRPTWASIYAESAPKLEARLSELTGKPQWRERALAFWCNATQCVSDGTLVINGRIRPTGSQDEAVFHTRWRRQSGAPFMPSQWLPAWPCAYRMENLRRHEDWSIFDEGLTNIEGKIVH